MCPLAKVHGNDTKKNPKKRRRKESKIINIGNSKIH
jgi:hypothetical protein